MNKLIHDHFLLKTRTAQRLFHEHAKALPIIDYHCHLVAGDLATDRSFDNLAQLWLVNDPYKHRAMRIAGVPERFITGNAGDREKFDAWAATVPQTLGNPLFHWSALELQRYFGISEMLSPVTADKIWHHANDCLRSQTCSARGLIQQTNVECLCTSDRLTDDLQTHACLAKTDFATRVLPSLRGDDLLAIEATTYPVWLAQLGTTTGTVINSFATFRQAVLQRLDVFHQLGCRLADHALDDFYYLVSAENETAALFNRRISGGALSPEDFGRLKSGLLLFLGGEYGRRGWAMQLHLGAQRDTSTRLRKLAGPAGGYAGIGKTSNIHSLCRFFDDLEQQSALPRTILYPLNPADNAALATLTGAYAEDGIRGKIQFGPAWWYNDHAWGIRQQLEATANYGLLSAFIGMTTDSRSLLSMTRHEYFRRVLCDFLGEQVESGLMPLDEALLGRYVRDIAYENARRWFLL
ncbi:MAG: glucuronate isomerase [Verrucomicrobiota bacterium]